MVRKCRDMSGRLCKVFGTLKFFLNLEDFLITCYIVKVSSPLLDSSSTTGGGPFYYIKVCATFLSEGLMYLFGSSTLFTKAQTLFDPESNCPFSNSESLLTPNLSGGVSTPPVDSL